MVFEHIRDSNIFAEHLSILHAKSRLVEVFDALWPHNIGKKKYYHHFREHLNYKKIQLGKIEYKILQNFL